MNSSEVRLYDLSIVNPSSSATRKLSVFAGSDEQAQAMALRDPSEVVTVERAHPIVESTRKLLFKQRATVSEMREFYAAMAGCMGIDPNLLRALEITIPSTNANGLRYAAARMLGQLREGASVSDALKVFEGVIPHEHIVMLTVGAESGETVSVFGMLADNVEKADRAIGKLKRALIYPSIVMTVGFLGLVLAAMFLMPQLAGMFKSFKADLPIQTKIMLALSDFLSANKWSLVVFAAVPVVIFKNIGSIIANPIVQSVFDRIPFVRRLLFRATMAKCLQMLSMLLRSHIKIDDALEMTAAVSTHHKISQFFLRMRADILRGASVFESANNNRAYLGPEGYMLMPLIQQGEQNGNLQDILRKVANRYQEEVETVVGNLNVFIEPATLILVGAFIAFIALSIYMPILKLNHLILPGRG